MAHTLSTLNSYPSTLDSQLVSKNVLPGQLPHPSLRQYRRGVRESTWRCATSNFSFRFEIRDTSLNHMAHTRQSTAHTRQSIVLSRQSIAHTRESIAHTRQSTEHTRQSIAHTRQFACVCVWVCAREGPGGARPPTPASALRFATPPGPPVKCDTNQPRYWSI